MTGDTSLSAQHKLLAQFQALRSSQNLDDTQVQDMLYKAAELNELNKHHERKRRDAANLFVELEQLVVQALNGIRGRHHYRILSETDDDRAIEAELRTCIATLKTIDLTHLFTGHIFSETQKDQIRYALLQGFLLDWNAKHISSRNHCTMSHASYFATFVTSVKADEQVTLLDSENTGTDIVLPQTYAGLLQHAITHGFLNTQKTYESFYQNKQIEGETFDAVENQDLVAYKEALSDFNKKLLLLISENLLVGPMNEHMQKVYKQGKNMGPTIEKLQKDNTLTYKDAKFLLDEESAMLDHLDVALQSGTTAQQREEQLELVKAGEIRIAQFIESKAGNNPNDDWNRLIGIVGLIVSTIAIAIGIACLVALSQGSIFGIAIAMTAPKVLATGKVVAMTTDAAIGFMFGGISGLIYGTFAAALCLNDLFSNHATDTLQRDSNDFNKAIEDTYTNTPQHPVINRNLTNFFAREKSTNDEDQDNVFKEAPGETASHYPTIAKL